MNTEQLFDPSRCSRAWIALILLVALCVGAVIVAWQIQTDSGRVEVSNERFFNETGIRVRAKLFRPRAATSAEPAPGVIFIPGFQSPRETGDGIAIELARRGVVVLEIDAIGRGNSGVPLDLDAPGFDDTFGGRAALAHLKSLPYVDAERVGMIGHSLGAEMCFTVARADSSVRATVLIGYAYTTEATSSMPQNMLMVFGRYDEFRDRMTGTSDVVAEWMSTDQTRAAIDAESPELGVTYGDFAEGTARRVLLPGVIHIGETHDAGVIAEVLEWIRLSLVPARGKWALDPGDQTWQAKEWSTLIAMLTGLAAVVPLALILLRRRAFASLRGPADWGYACSRREYLKHSGINGLLMWLYLPLVLVMFAVHKYLVPIDGAFPMMVVNGIAWWFLWINVIGFLLWRRWLRRRAAADGPSLAELGISFARNRLVIDWGEVGKAFLLAAILFGFVYSLQHWLEAVFIVDFRFVFAFASDLTGYRVLMFLLYYPFLLAGFLQLGFFLHGQLRRRARSSWARTFGWWTAANLAALVVPLLVFLSFQYLPLLTTGAIPFVGPGGMFVFLVINLFHVIGVLLMVVPISTWCFQLTGRPYLGAFLSAGIVAWMFTSSQVIAPVPV
jgi:dienelactone hydrolase